MITPKPRSAQTAAKADTTFPEIETERLLLEIGTIDDLDELDDYFSSEASRYVGGPRTRLESWEALCSGVGHWHLRGFGLWIIKSRHDGTQLGIVGLTQPDGWPEPEMIWVIYDQFSGQGIATEAIQAARKAAAEHFGIKTPISILGADHGPLIKMVERMGAQKDDTVDLPHGDTMAAWRFPEPEGDA
ncbi:GNAT family N-acetyltransferase [Pseudooceanicola sp. MF1-13]|uniref:GNAT family N-acetyltransferase n=1 Tax=Pseudooceanicola sp. MF1-13 TaxID=3379095 RepID=UPI003891987D